MEKVVNMEDVVKMCETAPDAQAGASGDGYCPGDSDSEDSGGNGGSEDVAERARRRRDRRRERTMRRGLNVGKHVVYVNPDNTDIEVALNPEAVATYKGGIKFIQEGL